MRIVLVTETWLPSTDGIVTRLQATVGELLRLGHQVLIIAPTAQRCEALAGVQVITVPTVRLRFVYDGRPWGWPVPAVGAALRRFAPDLVHVVNPVFLGIAGVLAARRRGYPLVASYHTDVAVYAGYYHLGWAAAVVHRLARSLHRRARVNLATSAAGQAALEGVGVSDVRLWPRGVDAGLFHPGRYDSEVRRRLVGADGGLLVLYVGRLAQEKSLEVLQPLARTPGMHLVLVGDGPDRARLQRRLSGAQVTFTGRLHGPALADVYAAADVFVFPSTSETLGLVLLEALASGVPVVAADTAASRAAVGGCDQVRLFTATDRQRIVQLVRGLIAGADRATRQRQARAAVAGLTWPAATGRLLEHYQTALAGRGAPCR